MNLRWLRPNPLFPSGAAVDVAAYESITWSELYDLDVSSKSAGSLYFVRDTNYGDGHWVYVDLTGNLHPIVPPDLRYRPRIAITGGSISNRCSYSTINPSDASNQDFGPHSWLQWWQAMAGQPFVIASLAGEGGRQIVECLAQFKVEIAAYSPDIVVLGGDASGNYLYNASGATPELAMGYVQQIYEKCVIIGARLIVWTLPPNENLSAARDTTKSANYATLEYNRQLVEWGSSKPDVKVVQFHPHTDHTDVDSRYVTTQSASSTATQWTHDGTHPHPRLSIKLAQLMDAAASTWTMQKPWIAHLANIDDQKAILNPLNYGTGGTLAGGATGSFVGNNCTLQGANTTCSQTARTDIGEGIYWKNVVVSSNNTGDVLYDFSGTASLPSSLTAGTSKIRALVEIKLNSTPTELRGFNVKIQFTGSSKTISGFAQSFTGGFASLGPSGPYIPTGQTLWLSTAVDAIPAAATAIARIRLTAARQSGATWSADFSVGRAIILAEDDIPGLFFNQTVP